ncbi:ABC transporter substrate-binding protein [Lactobacillus crispatus]|uniref:ABC transporter substrate-binding protein n=1 Tax=Lactobacillus crispatus TaxID=47770 RepID=UPI0019587D57|nr:ABC transporter substrate-binding protein [Lactobacillus crispatus]MBM6872218.1 ABC transporter substrate-binding protein [Lactobacillus crispatus]
MDKIDSYVRHFLILIALILGLSLVSELREIIAYDSSTIGIICTFASGITLQFHKLNWLTISLILILSAIVILFWFKTYTFGLVVSIFLIYNIIVFLVCVTNIIFQKKVE